ncbi:aspartate aminotransferase family protein [Azorhizobium doebereinerae]|uniref:aspartate aminotransferase family protein n=1 Tax=Azorhizobium doebereinerae TaxID=281091 RepID=UPI00040C8E24|nr:aspartate aminotransferase family protein [Azorhizobium doebereinerae]
MSSPIFANSTAHWRHLDAAHHLHPFSGTKALNAEGVRVITRAEGVYIYDSEGHKILDGMSGLWCTAVGHGRGAIVDAIADQLRQLDYYNTFFKTTHPGAAELSAAIAAVAPAGMERVFFTSGGSEAVDTVIRMVRHYWAAVGKPRKHIFIARRNAYHGSTIGGASLGGMKPMHAQGGLPIPGIIHVAQPYWWGEGGDLSPEEFGLKAALEVARAIDEAGPENVAAFIGEPIQGAGGVIIPPSTYWPEVQKICRERDVLLVSDEVICGFGRTGEWFGCQHMGVEPDLITFAKGVTAGYFPLGGVIVGGRVAEGLIAHGGEFHHGYTYSGHPGGCAAALATLKIMQEEDLVARVKCDIGPYLQSRWQALAGHPLVGEARMVGLIGALELTPHKASRAKFPVEEGTVGQIARDISFREGLVMRAVRDSLILAPPFTLSEPEADQIIATVVRVLNATEAEVRGRGLMGAPT